MWMWQKLTKMITLYAGFLDLGFLLDLDLRVDFTFLVRHHFFLYGVASASNFFANQYHNYFWAFCRGAQKKYWLIELESIIQLTALLTFTLCHTNLLFICLIFEKQKYWLIGLESLISQWVWNESNGVRTKQNKNITHFLFTKDYVNDGASRFPPRTPISNIIYDVVIFLRSNNICF